MAQEGSLQQIGVGSQGAIRRNMLHASLLPTQLNVRELSQSVAPMAGDHLVPLYRGAYNLSRSPPSLKNLSRVQAPVIASHGMAVGSLAAVDRPLQSMR